MCTMSCFSMTRSCAQLQPFNVACNYSHSSKCPRTASKKWLLGGSCSLHGRRRMVQGSTNALNRHNQALQKPLLPEEQAASVALLLVTMLWATYAPAIKLFYDIPGSPDPTILTAAKACIASLSLTLAIPLEQNMARRRADDISTTAAVHQRTLEKECEDNGSSTHLSSNNGLGSRVDSEQCRHSHAEAHSQPEPSGSSTGSTGGLRDWLRSLLNKSTSSLFLASSEIGMYSAIGSMAQAWSISKISATQAGFLMQFTAVLTPIIALLAGEAMSRRTWRASLYALAGTVLITWDGFRTGAADAVSLDPSLGVQQVLDIATSTATDLVASDGGLAAAAAAAAVAAHTSVDLGNQIAGDSAMLASAFCYSIATYRISVLAPEFTAVEFAAGKTTGMAVFAVLVASLSVVWPLLSSGADLTVETLWPNYSNAAGWLLVVFAALGPGALASALQTFGQASVPSARTQVIFSTIPLWSALIAYLVLHEDLFGPAGWVGASLIIVAGLSASR